jgi:hypothetical protein
MLGVDSESGLSSMRADGILGMSPKTQAGESEELFVQKLYEAGRISANQFGVDYRSTSGTSKIVLGGYDTSVVANPQLFAYIGLKDTYYWSLNMKKMWYGNDELDVDAERGILDTGTSLTYWQSSDWNVIWNKISSGKTCGTSSTTGFKACL